VQEISEIILTASGGPFRKLSLEEMKIVTAKDALSHPTWKMGKKITIDSASMANKGLEIIEACHFFDMPVEKIKVVIHPQSIVHSMIRLRNGTLYAQLSKPDMRHPISDALYFPKPAPLNFDNLNFDSLNLEFEKPDQKKFPMLYLAYEAAEQGGLYPCAYNAANEEAVTAFLNNEINFLDIPKITGHVLESDWNLQYSEIQTVLKADADARMKAIKYIKKME
jgi:1-deoxy-D-xylulose-5-phosphate reductoisomerase